MQFRQIEANEIQCRVQSCGKMGLKLLLYKDARCDMNILDETVGAENWQCRYSESKGILFCDVGINVNYNIPDAEPRWIWKSDAGSESNMESEKGNASDAFKRACFRWNIGRALYSAPDIQIWADDKRDGSKNAVIKENKNGGNACYDSFSVEKIAYSDDGKQITGLAIRNDSLGKRVFVWATK